MALERTLVWDGDSLVWDDDSLVWDAVDTALAPIPARSVCLLADGRTVTLEAAGRAVCLLAGGRSVTVAVGTLSTTPLDFPEPVDPDNATPAPTFFDLTDWLAQTGVEDTIQSADVVAIDPGITPTAVQVIDAGRQVSFQPVPASAAPGEFRVRCDFTTVKGYTQSLTGVVTFRQT